MPTLSHRQILTVMGGLMLGMLVAALSQTIVATALPTIVGELGGQDQLAWVVSATLLTTTASTPVWGKLSDLWGRKILLQAAVVVFVIGSVAAGLSQDMPQLIATRAFQGLGIGGLLAMTQAIMGDIVSPRERGRYQGYLGSAFGVATVAGPLIGGFLVDRLSWRWCFFVAIPIAAVALIVTERVLNLPFPRRHRKIDWLGAGLIVAGVSAVLLVLSLAGKQFPWNSAPTYLLGGGALVLLALAIWQERRAEEPIMPPRLFRIRTFSIVALAAFVAGTAMFSAIVYLPQYLQIVKGMSPTVSGLQTLPLVGGLMLASIGSGQLITRTGRYKIFPIVGMSMVTIGLLLLSRAQVGTAMPRMSLSMLVVGLGLGMVVQVLVLAAQNAVDHGDLGVATSGATFFRSMGGALGVSVFGALFSSQLTTTIPERLAAAGVPMASLGDGSQAKLLGSPTAIANLPDPVHLAVIGGFADALHTVFLAAVPVALLGLIVVLFLPETPLRSAPTPASGSAAPEPAAPAAPARAMNASAAPLGGGAVGRLQPTERVDSLTESLDERGPRGSHGPPG